MQTISIEAKTLESALALYNVLFRFRADLRESDDGRQIVEVDLDGSECEVVEVLNAIEDYVAHRDSGPARIAFNGRRYAL